MLPAAVLLSIAGTPLWGPAVTLILVKAVAAAFVITGILWYRAEDNTPGGEVEVDETPAPAEDLSLPGIETPVGTAPSLQEILLSSEAGFPIDPITGEEIFEEAMGADVPERPAETPRRAWDIPLHAHLPRDAEIFQEFENWALYYSDKEKSFYIQSTDYHPKPLRLTKKQLLEMVVAVEDDTAEEEGDN